jgi:hypothetical protein
MLKHFGRLMPDIEMNRRNSVLEMVDYYCAAGEKYTHGVDKLQLDEENYGGNVTIEPFWKDEVKRQKALIRNQARETLEVVA